jgi:membrane carboxypeptidase/penicillin-binding protein PbpC
VLDWTPHGPGFARVTVTDANGESASVAVRLD